MEALSLFHTLLPLLVQVLATLDPNHEAVPSVINAIAVLVKQVEPKAK